MKDVFPSILTILAIAGGVAFAQSRMPDSPTGRMAQALIELADASESDRDAFVEERVAPQARGALESVLLAYRDALEEPTPRGAEKTGAFTAVVTLLAGGRTFEIDYEVESEPPHRLVSFAYDATDAGPKESGLPPVEGAPGAGPAEVTAAYLDKLESESRFSGSVLVARGDEILFEDAVGLAERESKRKNTTSTLFDVGSITKMMTKIAIGQLARDGKLSLGDSLEAHLPDYPNPEIAKRITLTQMIEHRSGLGDVFTEAYAKADKSKLLHPRDFFPLFENDPLQFEPGTSESYSNAAYIVLGAVIEAASGMNYVDYVNEHVFGPAGVSGEGFVVRDKSRDDVAVGYTRDEGSESLSPNLGMLPVRGCPAGSSSHTARGLYRIERALARGELLGPAWTRWYHDGTIPSRDDEDVPFFEVGFAIAGGGPGVNAVLASEDGMIFVVLANQDPPIAGEMLRRLQETWRESS